MSVIVEFPSDEDHIKAIDILAEAEESYEGTKGGIIISNKAARLLKKRDVKFSVFGGESEEKHYASNP